MLLLKKIQALAETFFWLFAVLGVICLGMPLYCILMLAGSVLGMVKIKFVTHIADYVMDGMLGFLRFVTEHVKKRTQEITELRDAL